MCESHSIMSSSAIPWTIACYAPLSIKFSRQEYTGVDYHSLLQGIFLTQGMNPGLLHCTQILYQLSQKGSPRILEWVKVKVTQLSLTLCDPMKFSKPEYWSGYPFPSPGHFPSLGIEPGSPGLQADSLTAKLSGKP